MKFKDIIKESLDLKNDKLLKTKSGNRAFSWRGQDSIGGDMDEYIEELNKVEEEERQEGLSEGNGVTVNEIWDQAKEAENVESLNITRKDQNLFEAEVKFDNGETATFECTE